MAQLFASQRELVQKLIIAELLARPGHGPLARPARRARARALRTPMPPEDAPAKPTPEAGEP